ncbi:MAG: ATP-binding protein, partial [Syntrophomonadaceae bacterium]|nr:ATP-binding protein [Syntrophomonadaceae bacterium]
MLAITRSLCLQGIEATPVTVEVDIHNGLPAFDIVGLASQSVKEAKERVRAAIKNSGFEFPLQRITVNLAPADLRKEGSHFDLAIALGILLASRQVEGPVQEAFMAGEVSLDGSLRQVPGVLPMVLALCQTCPGAHLLIPPGNAAEAALVPGLRTWLAPSLAAAAAHLSGNRTLSPVTPAHAPPATAGTAHPDLSDIRGQEGARRALEVAAAGGHNLLLIGPPGSGKTMLARRLPGILPPMTREEVLDASRIYSVAGLLHRHGALVSERPFRAPHHTASSAAVIGGGRSAHPGEVSLAHHGVL